MPSPGSVPGTQKASNKKLWMKNQKLWKSEGWEDMETSEVRVGGQFSDVPGEHFCEEFHLAPCLATWLRGKQLTPAGTKRGQA